MNNNETNAKVGRPAAEGRRHQYVVADDVHQWIFEHGGSKYLTDTIRAIMAVSPDKQEGTAKSERQRVWPYISARKFDEESDCDGSILTFDAREVESYQFWAPEEGGDLEEDAIIIFFKSGTFQAVYAKLDFGNPIADNVAAAIDAVKYDQFWFEAD